MQTAMKELRRSGRVENRWRVKTGGRARTYHSVSRRRGAGRARPLQRRRAAGHMPAIWVAPRKTFRPMEMQMGERVFFV